MYFLISVAVIKLKYDFSSAVKLWRVQLKWSNEDDEQSKKLVETLKNEIGDISSLRTLGDFLTKVGKHKEAENYYRLLEEILPETEGDWPNIYNRIAYVKYEKEEYKTTLDYLKLALERAPKDSEEAAVIQHNQQTIANELSHTSKYQTTLRRKLEDNDIITKYLVSNSALEAIIKNNYGRIRHQQGDFEGALKDYDDALTILRKSELNYLPEISAVYNNIGSVQYSKGNYTEAAKQFLLAMTTLTKLDSSHPWIREYNDNYKAAQRQIDSNKAQGSAHPTDSLILF
jgi:tetratricopeptide (TPR) repeat protein